MKNHIDKAWSFAITGEGGGRQQHNVLRVVIREKNGIMWGKFPNRGGGGSIFQSAGAGGGRMEGTLLGVHIVHKHIVHCTSPGGTC